MLTLYRRHAKPCKLTSRSENKCRCPIWAGGSLPGTGEIRQSLDTRSWSEAQQKILKWSVDRQQPPAPQHATIAQWREQFMDDVKARHLVPATVTKYNRLFNQLTEWSRGRQLLLVSDLTTGQLGTFRTTWVDGPLSSAKKLERLRAIFRFAVQRDWIKTNPARDLKAPKLKHTPTLPYTEKEMEAVIKAAEKYSPAVLAFVYVMRYSGLRISDAAMLKVSALDGDRIHLYTAKTGTPVRVPLPRYVADALRKLTRVHPDYFFYRGHATPQAAGGLWMKKLAKVFTAAKITNGHSHRLRDTFAVSLLQAGVSIETVAVLLGHATTQVTQRHYSPWVKIRQDLLEREIARVNEIGEDFH